MEFKWYSIRVTANKEIKFKTALEEEIKINNLQELVKQIVVPLTKIVQIKDNKKVMKDKPMFPGFVFVEMALSDRLLDLIRKIPGYRGMILDSKKRPVPMRESDVARILFPSQSEQIDESAITRLYVGDKVKIIEGPLVNFIGEISEIYPEKKKVKVNIKIFGRKTPVELSLFQIEKI